MSNNIVSAPPPGKEEAILRDSPDPTNALLKRLDSWIHVVDMIDEYVDSHIIIQRGITAGLEKARKAVYDAPNFNYSQPPQQQGEAPVNAEGAAAPTHITGIAESFEALRTRTDTLINKSYETENAIKTGVLPQLVTLKGDIEKHIKGLKSTGVKNLKEIEKARNLTQASIENLGTRVSSFNISAHTKHEYKNDPYVLHRYVRSALEDQVAKENNQIDAVISVEKNMETLEKHIVQVIQQAISLLESNIHSYSALKVESYDAINQTFAAIPPGHEWDQFLNSPSSPLIAYNTPKRNIDNIYFNNSDASPTKAIYEGIMQRKEGKLLKSYTSGYYVLTPSRFLLQYGSQNPVTDPTPDFAIYLPESQVGDLSPRSSGKNKFVIQAKDCARTIGLGHKNYSFKTNTYDECVAWYNAITNSNPTSPGAGSPYINSPVLSHQTTFESTNSPPVATPVAVPAAAPAAAPAASPAYDTAAAPDYNPAAAAAAAAAAAEADPAVSQATAQFANTSVKP